MSEATPAKSNSEYPPSLRPRLGRIPAALSYSGFGRSKLYEIAAETPGPFKKSGTATLVDFSRLDEVLDALPAASIKSRSTCRRA